MRDYRKDITINHNGEEKFNLYTLSGIKVATGYNRIVFGDRGPYIEFTKEQVIKESMFIPKDKLWKFEKRYAEKVYYMEMRTYADNVKVYFQRQRVDYADYNPGHLYINPFDLYTIKGDAIIEPVKETKQTIDSGGVLVLKKKAQVIEQPTTPVKISKKDKDFSYDRIHEYLTKRFDGVEKLNKADYIHFKGMKTILDTKIQEKDSLLPVVVLHTNNLECQDSHIAIHFKHIALRELDKVCKKFYLVKARREPVLVEIEYMFNEVSRKKITEEYEC